MNSQHTKFQTLEMTKLGKTREKGAHTHKENKKFILKKKIGALNKKRKQEENR